MWDTRPPRIPSDQGGNARIAGVCEGIGVRYQIDPTVVRVIFVVSAFTLGGGVAAYLLAWMMMPRYGMTTSPAEAVGRRKEPLDPTERRERGTGWWLLFFFLVFFVTSTGFALPAIALLLGGWWLLHAKEPAPPAGLIAVPTTTPTGYPGQTDQVVSGGIPFAQAPPPRPAEQQAAPHTAAMPTMEQPVDLSGFAPAEGYPTPPGRTTPPTWDPLGTASFAWDLPDPGPAPQPKRKKARIWPWVLLGIGAVLAAFTTFLALFAGPLGTVHFDDDTVGDQRWAPVNGQELQPAYSGGVGSTDLDLSGLAPLNEERTVEVNGGIGSLDIQLPTGVPVELECVSGLGELDCRDGLYNEDAEGETLTLTVQGGVGQAAVHGAE
ncbi:hypothetical protein A605_03000 [Corynebacterium halotolerans YIM 70093 = DSM 44683]|uniref:Phage shock protein PspC N-terminal domain-containing protein n=2 Tax=Corynebacterium halotolerans TaxID=225326 RepID=M1MV68_9CORY|nr:hypothetical protein A605_03000 [Corynebacterium halotolerans YIM 70093 = DSM 44683]